MGADFVSAFEKLDALYAAIEDTARLGVWEWELEGGIVRWSPGLYKLFQLDPRRYKPSFEGNVELVIAQDREWARSEMLRATRTREAFSLEARVARADGAVLTVHVWGRPLVGSAGRAVALVGVCQDVSEAAGALAQARRAEAEFKARLEKESSQAAYQAALLRALQECSPDGMLVVDERGRIQARNDRFLEIWGIPHYVVADGSDEAALAFVRDKLARPDEFEERVRWLYAHADERSFDVIPLRDGRVLERFSSPVADERRRYGRVWFFRVAGDVGRWPLSGTSAT